MRGVFIQLIYSGPFSLAYSVSRNVCSYSFKNGNFTSVPMQTGRIKTAFSTSTCKWYPSYEILLSMRLFSDFMNELPDKLFLFHSLKLSKKLREMIRKYIDGELVSDYSFYFIFNVASVTTFKSKIFDIILSKISHFSLIY